MRLVKWVSRKGCIAVFILVILSVLGSCVSAAPLVTVVISNGDYSESLTVLDPKDGNWVELEGGEDLAIPPLELVYHGVNQTSYVENGKTITVTSPYEAYEDYSVPYPRSSHPIYHTGDRVTVNVYVQSDLGQANGEQANGEGELQCYIYLMKTGPVELRDALNAGVHGNTAPIRNLFATAITKTIPIRDTPLSATFDGLAPGDYAVAATIDPYNAQNITLISISAFTILEHHSTPNVPPVVQRPSTNGGFVTGNFTITDGNANARYTYIAALIKNETYTVKLQCNGTKAGTNLSLNNALLVDGFRIGDAGLNKIDQSTIVKWLTDASTAASVGKETKQGTTYEFDLPVGGLPDSDYILYVGAWNVTNSSQRVVAVSQESVKIQTVEIVPTPTPSPTPAPTPRGPIGRTYTPSIPTDFTGKLTSSVTICSDEGRACVTMHAGTTALDARGQPLKEITFSVPPDLPPPLPPGVLVLAIELGPAGATFSPPIELCITFDPAELAGKIPVIYTYTAEGWKALETTVTGNKACAKVDHFSIFVLFAESVAPTPAPSPEVTPTPPPASPTPVPTPTPPPFAVVPLVIILVILALVILVAATYLVRRRR